MQEGFICMKKAKAEYTRQEILLIDFFPKPLGFAWI